jgi:hypothetical protein
MWKCPKCDEQMGDAVDACWKCGVKKDGTEGPVFTDLRDAQIPNNEQRKAANEAYAVLGTKTQERRIPLSGEAGITFLYALTVLPFLVLPPAYVLWQLFGPLTAAVYLLLFVLAWRLCGGVAATCAAWTLLFTLSVYDEIGPWLSLIPASITVLLLGFGYSDKQKRLRRRQTKTRTSKH